jgi:hypothetical protein
MDRLTLNDYIVKTKFTLKYLVIAISFVVSSCGAVKLSLRPHEGPPTSTAYNNITAYDDMSGYNHIVEEESCNCEEKVTSCEECKVIPKSGMMRDLRYGYYYDPKEKKCKRISYSSGGIPAPFKTMEECKSCCCKSWR